jgi:GNAT superfamily N-acetyltransferase
MNIQKADYEDSQEMSRLIRRTLETVNSLEYTPAQLSILIQAHSPEWIREQIKQFSVFCIKEDRKLAGTILLEGELARMLYVRNDRLRKGIGTKLMDFIENYARQENRTKIKVYVTVSASEFYKRLGYKSGSFEDFDINGTTFRYLEMEKLL